MSKLPPPRIEAPATAPAAALSPLRRLLAVGGAPRSGTSMMLAALDGHPEIAAFPFEPSGMASVLCGRELPQVMKEDQLADPRWLAMRAEGARAQGGVDAAGIFSTFDPEVFARLLRVRSDNYAADLHRAYLSGLGPPAGAYLGGDPIFALKLPFFMEAGFSRVRTWAPDTRLIHLRRSAVDRYLSCKKRAIAGGVMRPRKGFDYTTFQALLHRSSEASAAGHDQAMSVDYETLVARPRDTLEAVCAFLDIGWSDSLLAQTQGGAPAPLPSAYGFMNGGGDDDAMQRRAGGLAISSPAERAYHGAVAKGDLPEARRQAAEAFALESPENRAARQVVVESLSLWIDQPTRLRDMIMAGGVSIL